ncbi:MAG: DUF418 domain-containing protein [Deltaproteobacteria bacterium]|nr:DUF418 domain-containing protein [Deltaproteobacteria bacterium]
MESPSVTVGPVRKADRFGSLDVLRGLAILGILVMNIQSFSMPMSAYTNPSAYGDLTGGNLWVWLLSYIFTMEKFMTLFSILFGAGIVLMTSRAEARGGKPAKWHYRRMLWLMVIGFLHAHLLWYGDILFTYGVCALLVYFLRKKSPKTLLIVGIAVFSVASLLAIMAGVTLPSWPEVQIDEMTRSWNPEQYILQDEVDNYRGGWWRQMDTRTLAALMLQTGALLMFVFWKSSGLMLIGMALFKWGILTAQASKKVYLSLMAVGFGVGFPLVIWGALQHLEHGFAFEYSMFLGSQPNYWGSALVCLGYISATVLVYLSGRLKGVMDRLAAVGRMAFTNYLMQTVICTSLFYGHGLGLFGQVERKEQILFVMAIWAFQLWLSPIWLRRFRFGPAEWLWRSLTYRRLQPMKIGAVPTS